jgi:flagellar biosynthesis chaperone FliJ
MVGEWDRSNMYKSAYAQVAEQTAHNILELSRHRHHYCQQWTECLPLIFCVREYGYA